jgi:hypothetical protein
MGKVFRLILYNLFVVWLLLEITLRIFPNVIPPVVLIHFEPNLRGEIAKGRFKTKDQVITLDRDDGGPPLHAWKPFESVVSMGKFVNAENDPGFVAQVTMDENGFCNVPGSYQVSPLDIVTIGDSFTWCNTVRPEDTWTKRISDFTKLSTYNLGKGGIGLYEYLQILKQFGIQKSPRYVIMNVYEGNDLRDAISFYKFQNRQTRGEDSKNSSKLWRKKYYLFLKNSLLGRHSYAFNLILHLKKAFKKEVDFRYNLVFTERSIPFNLENSDLDEIKYAKRLLAQQIDLNVFDAALGSLMKLGQQHNFIPIVAYTPSAHTTYHQNVVFNDPQLASLMPWFSNEQRSYFKRKGDDLGYFFIDLTPGLQSVAPEYNTPEKLLYNQTNLHLTKYGHAVVAKTLSAVIQEVNSQKQN